MYKDKPYFAPRRTGPRLRRRRAVYGVGVLVFLAVVWYYVFGGWGGPALKTPDSARGEALWAWVQSLDSTDPTYDGTLQKGIDWAARREKVRDTMIVSWDSYEQHGWGMRVPSPESPFERTMLTPNCRS
jgi:mannosyl-oligosaccharide alpha-1,2-mannosidase